MQITCRVHSFVQTESGRLWTLEATRTERSRPVTSTDTFATTFAALYAAHHVADHWIQTDRQARDKGRRGSVGRRACAAHVASYTAAGGVALAVTNRVTRADVTPSGAVAALAVSGLSHYWIDRRFTLAALARRCGLGGFYRLGAPRPGHDDNPTLGTGAYVLDQSAHVGMIWAAALVASAVGRRRHPPTS